MKNNTEIRESIKKGLDLAFRRLLKAKQQSNGMIVFSENGIIRKVKAAELH